MDVMQSKSHIYLMLEFAAGGDLSDALAQHNKALNEKEVRYLLCQIAAGLKVLHGASIVHRDLKP